MSKGYIKIGSIYITVWRVLIWAVMLLTFIILSPVIVPLGLLTIIFVSGGVIGSPLLSTGKVTGAVVAEVFANKFSVAVVNSLAEKHIKLMAWAKNKDDL